MAGLQRSSISFRRQGSSGLIWDDKLFSGELTQPENQKDQESSPETTAAAVSKASGSGDRAALPQEQELKTEEVMEEVKREDHGLMVKIERSRSNGGGRGFRTGKVAPAVEPPSPKISAYWCCSGLRKYEKSRRIIKNGKRKM